MHVKNFALAIAGVLALACGGAAFASDDTVTAKNAAGSTIIFCSKDTGSGVMASCVQLIKPDGTKITPRQETAEPAGENHVGEVGGRTAIVGASPFTTASASAYSVGQLIANSGTAGSVTVLQFSPCRVTGGTGMVRRARIKVATDTGFAGQTLTLKLYRDSPTLTNGDHGVWLTTESNYIGSIDVTLDQHFSDFEKGIGAPAVGNEINFDCAGGSQNLYGLLTAGSGFTPAGTKAITTVLETLVN